MHFVAKSFCSGNGIRSIYAALPNETIYIHSAQTIISVELLSFISQLGYAINANKRKRRPVNRSIVENRFFLAISCSPLIEYRFRFNGETKQASSFYEIKIGEKFLFLCNFIASGFLFPNDKCAVGASAPLIIIIHTLNLCTKR